MIEFLSLLTAVMYALSNIYVRKGLVFGSNSTTAATVSLFFTFIIFLGLLLVFFPTETPSVRAMFYYLAAGVLAPGLFRFFLYSAISRIGVAVTSISTNSFPLVASLIAIGFLNERLTLFKAVGMLFTMGAAFLAAPRSEKRIFDPGILTNVGFLLGITAAVVRGASEVLRKAGLIEFNDPILGAAMGNAGGFLFSMALLAVSRSTRNSLTYQRTSFYYFFVSSIFVVAAWIIGFYALSYGDVVRVTPVVGTVPLLTVLLSALLLRGLEQITLRIVIASLLAAAGVAAIRLGS